MNRRGQAAMEFLMTYGWAILVVLIALGALFYLGVFSPKVPNICNIPAPFVCQDVKFSDSTLILRVGASGVSSITYVVADAIMLNGGACAVTDDGDGGVGGDDGQADAMKSTVVSVTCTNGAIVDGSKVSGTIDLVYTLVGSSLTHEIQGSFSGAAEA